MTVLAPASGTVDTALPTFDPRLHRVLCVVVVACAIKAPLGMPVYLNGGLLLLGLFALLAVRSMQQIFLWMVVMIVLGALAAAATGHLGSSGPRLGQLALIVLAASLIARLDPDQLARLLPLLVVAMVLVAVVESLLPEPLFHARRIWGVRVHRQGGLHGEPNYAAMLYGVVAVMLAQHRPRALAVLPLLLALPMLSRGIWLAALAWLVFLALGRRGTRLALAAILLICLQPLLVLAVDGLLSEATRAAWVEASTGRWALWIAYARMGIDHPLGVGYFQGAEALALYDRFLPPGWPLRYAHSLFLQVFGEFGWLGYLLFVGFLLHVARLAARAAPEQLPLMVFLLTGYALINGLSDWAFWVPLGYVLARVRLAETGVGAPGGGRAGAPAAP